MTLRQERTDTFPPVDPVNSFENLGSFADHVGDIRVKINEEKIKTEEGQWVFAKVVDESGKEALYNIHIVRKSEDLTYTVKADPGALSGVKDPLGKTESKPFGIGNTADVFFKGLASGTCRLRDGGK